RRLDLRHDAPRRHPGDIPRYVIPFRAAVLRVPDLAIVRTGPDDSPFHVRRRDREDHRRRELPEVVADDAAGRDDLGWILRREIRADHGPALATVGRPEDDVAAVIHVVVIE